MRKSMLHEVTELINDKPIDFIELDIIGYLIEVKEDISSKIETNEFVEVLYKLRRAK
ncbi:hypothetical protein [Arcticibacter eurypsychrophilus]|uniref:hypothetical protein n=1 Tax=Arcticibacter eurypsychrophilus TaxID=1434752 RepID=UPI00148150DE|nr:hypothetical protein [Arcticibacter eurypsychrophilus]